MKNLKNKLKDLEEQNNILRLNNLRMRLEIEQLVDRPDSKAAKKIRRKYRIKKAIRRDAELAMMN